MIKSLKPTDLLYVALVILAWFPERQHNGHRHAFSRAQSPRQHRLSLPTACFLSSGKAEVKNGLCVSDFKGQNRHRELCLRHNPFLELPLAFAGTMPSSKPRSAGSTHYPSRVLH